RRLEAAYRKRAAAMIPGRERIDHRDAEPVRDEVANRGSIERFDRDARQETDTVELVLELNARQIMRPEPDDGLFGEVADADHLLARQRMRSRQNADSLHAYETTNLDALGWHRR